MWDQVQGVLDRPIPSWIVLAVALPILAVLLYIAHRQQNPPQGPARAWLAKQIERLAAAGVHLRPGVGLKDLLAEHPASAYQAQPALVLAVYGGIFPRDDDWQAYSDQVTHFDYECIDDPDCYETAVFEPLTDLLPPEVPRSIACYDDGVLTITIGSQTRRLTPRIDDDWADEAVVCQILDDIDAALPEPQILAEVEDGQAITVCVLNQTALPALKKELTPDLQQWRSQTV